MAARATPTTYQLSRELNPQRQARYLHATQSCVSARALAALAALTCLPGRFASRLRSSLWEGPACNMGANSLRPLQGLAAAQTRRLHSRRGRRFGVRSAARHGGSAAPRWGLARGAGWLQYGLAPPYLCFLCNGCRGAHHAPAPALPAQFRVCGAQRRVVSAGPSVRTAAWSRRRTRREAPNMALRRATYAQPVTT